jgi:hypothetical protein
MKRISAKKSFGLLCIIATLGVLPLYGQNDSIKNKSELAKFEIDFAEYRINQERTGVSSGDSAAVYLLGFMILPESDSKKFGDLPKEQQEAARSKIGSNFYLSSDLSCFRLYTFLRDGEIEYNGKSYTANAGGIVKLASPVDVSKIKILGKKTARGDIAGSDYKLSSSYQYSDRKIVVYDLGRR